MRADFSIRDSSNEPAAERSQRPFRLIVIVAVALLVFVGVLIQKQLERRVRAEALRVREYVPESSSGDSRAILFSLDDVEVVRGWTFLSGSHPTVRFSCRLAPSMHSARTVVLCYRPLGTEEWQTVEARAGRGRIWKVVLRDLYREMPYECFFVAYNKDTMARSKCVVIMT